ncbi:fibroblast growth factor 4A-like [Menidia menidia]
MLFTKSVSSPLPTVLLLLAVCDQLVRAVDPGEGGPPEGDPEDRGSQLRALWKLHMRDFLQTEKGPDREVVKQQLLYCRAGIGYHLQILPSGLVGGVHKPTEYCWLKVFALKCGVVGIRGVRSGLYLCMKGKGLAYGAEQFSDECLFRENLEENHYNTYLSYSHPGYYLALSRKGQLRRANSVNHNQSCTHFLPRTP